MLGSSNPHFSASMLVFWYGTVVQPTPNLEELVLLFSWPLPLLTSPICLNRSSDWCSSHRLPIKVCSVHYRGEGSSHDQLLDHIFLIITVKLALILNQADKVQHKLRLPVSLFGTDKTKATQLESMFTWGWKYLKSNSDKVMSPGLIEPLHVWGFYIILHLKRNK